MSDYEAFSLVVLLFWLGVVFLLRGKEGRWWWQEPKRPEVTQEAEALAEHAWETEQWRR